MSALAIDTVCKNPACGKVFPTSRPDARYCSGACRVAVHRARQFLPPPTSWLDDSGAFDRKATVNGDGSTGLSNADLADKLVQIAHDGDGGAAKTGRRYYYLALSYGYIKPDMAATKEGTASRSAAYKRVTKILGKLRQTARLGWDMVLDLTRDLIRPLAYGSPREARASMRNFYDEDRWLGQKWFPVLVVEKDTLAPVCLPMADKWRALFASSRGYSSLTLQHDVAKALNERYARTKQWAIIYFVSDLDPSGLDLQRSWEEAMKQFGVRCIFERIGLTRDQVRDNRADSGMSLEDLSIEVKASDSRSASYIAQYGNRCWEADILPGAVIEAALDQDINSWLDHGMWNRRDAEIERARGLL